MSHLKLLQVTFVLEPFDFSHEPLRTRSQNTVNEQVNLREAVRVVNIGRRGPLTR